MITKNQNAPAGATNTNEGNNEPSINSNHDQHTVIAHIRRTGGVYYDGRAFDRQDSPVYINRDDIRRLGNPRPVVICRECAEAVDAEARAKREREAQREEFLAWQRALAEEERAIIRQVTGRDDISRDDLQYELVDAYRASRDVTVWLDALKALDDAALKRAGRTSWDDGEDDDA
ncbi:hypothetical protein CHU71_02515 [Corynebacterium sp. LK14]|uniref:hypothetical protein n=1 Tax=Corynebacterium sp. LK14 TaxID=2022659 RepID=UPI0011C7DCAC|nr:hypothetical protein [Corynebacterium sp. LK14]TXS65803.1 hypothetical protein CHU71_02515 [Corynebacterium sp. LK14]